MGDSASEDVAALVEEVNVVVAKIASGLLATVCDVLVGSTLSLLQKSCLDSF